MLVQSILIVPFSIDICYWVRENFGRFASPGCGLFALQQGAIFILGYFFADPFGKSQAELILGIIFIAASLFLLTAITNGLIPGILVFIGL